jgi:hypothetical protein
LAVTRLASDKPASVTDSVPWLLLTHDRDATECRPSAGWLRADCGQAVQSGTVQAGSYEVVTREETGEKRERNAAVAPSIVKTSEKT